jgi:hypothetical protein
VPEALRKAQAALAQAEKSFRDNPKSYRTQGLASLAYREAKIAEELANTAAGNAATAKTDKDSQSTTPEFVKQR